MQPRALPAAQVRGGVFPDMGTWSQHQPHAAVVPPAQKRCTARGEALLLEPAACAKGSSTRACSMCQGVLLTCFGSAAPGADRETAADCSRPWAVRLLRGQHRNPPPPGKAAGPSCPCPCPRVQPGAGEGGSVRWVRGRFQKRNRACTQGWDVGQRPAPLQGERVAARLSGQRGLAGTRLRGRAPAEGAGMQRAGWGWPQDLGIAPAPLCSCCRAPTRPPQQPQEAAAAPQQGSAGLGLQLCQQHQAALPHSSRPS